MRKHSPKPYRNDRAARRYGESINTVGGVMFTLTGTAPDGDTARAIDFDLDGDRLHIHIHPPEKYQAGQSIVVSADQFRAAVQSTDFTLSGTSPVAGKPKQVTFGLKQEMSIYIFPAEPDESGETSSGWEIHVNMDQLRDALVRGGLVSDSKPTGIASSATAFRRPPE